MDQTTNQQGQQSQQGLPSLESLGITPLGSAPIPNNDIQSTQGMLVQNAGQGEVANTASQVPGGETPKSPLAPQRRGEAGANPVPSNGQTVIGNQYTDPRISPKVEQMEAVAQSQGKDLYGYQPSINPNDSVELSDLGMTKGSKASSRVNTSEFNSVGSDVVEGGVPTNSLLATQNSSVHVNNDQYTIVAVRYDGSGISAVQLNTGDIITAEQAIYLAEQKLIAGIHTGGTRGNSPHKTLVSNPDGDPANNLASLPRF